MAGYLRRTFADPRIGRHLLRDEGEVIVDEVHKHWVVYIKPSIEGLLALALVVGGLFVRVDIAWLPWLVAVALAAHGGWKALTQHMDRFLAGFDDVHRIFYEDYQADRLKVLNTVATAIDVEPFGEAPSETIRKVSPDDLRQAVANYDELMAAAAEMGLRTQDDG